MNTAKKSKLKFQIYQIYFDQNSGQNIDPSFIPYNNVGVKTKGYENEVLIDVWINKRKEWKDADYVGVLSWRFFEKTKLRGVELFKIAAKNNEPVISIFPKGYSATEHPYKRIHYKNILKLTQLVDKAQIFDFKLSGYPIKRNIWCNYWIASPEVFEFYCSCYLNKIMTLFNTTKDPELLEALESTERHRGRQYSVVTFFLEGLFSVFCHRENINYFEVV